MMYNLKLGKNRKTTAEQISPTIQSSAGEIAPTTTGIDKTRNIKHPGTFRNIPEHPGT